MGRQRYRKEMAQYETDRAVKQSEIPQPVTCRKATAEEMQRVGNRAMVDYETCYDQKYNSYWKEFEAKHYGK